MPLALKKWLAGAATVFLCVSLVSLWNKEYGAALSGLIVHPDFTISYLLKIGFSKWQSIALAIIFGTLGLCHIYWVSEQSAPIFKKILRLFGFDEDDAKEKRHPSWAKGWPYTALFFFPSDPYLGASLGMGFARAMKLKKLPAFTMLALGNSAKMIVIGEGMGYIYETTNSWSTLNYLAVTFGLLSLTIILAYLIRRMS